MGGGGGGGDSEVEWWGRTMLNTWPITGCIQESTGDKGEGGGGWGYGYVRIGL